MYIIAVTDDSLHCLSRYCCHFVTAVNILTVVTSVVCLCQCNTGAHGGGYVRGFIVRRRLSFFLFLPSSWLLSVSRMAYFPYRRCCSCPVTDNHIRPTRNTAQSRHCPQITHIAASKITATIIRLRVSFFLFFDWVRPRGVCTGGGGRGERFK
jgi:hypothetical protein